MIAGIALPTLVILAVMMGIVSGAELDSQFPFLHVQVDFPALLQANTPTGGDMGAHVLLPQYLRDDLLPSGRIMGWSNDWYAGYPALYFYFPLPALFTVFLDVFLPYGVAFKITTMLGLVTLPAAVYYMVRSLGFIRPVAAIASTTGAMYVFMESFSIFGGNVKSTMAGEFSFSWSLSLSLIYLGMVIRDTRREGKPTPWAGVVLGLTALSHIVTTMVVVVLVLPLLFRPRGPAVVVRSWVIGFAISAFWAIPFALRFAGLTTDMGWTAVSGLVGDSPYEGIVATPIPGEFVPILALGVIGLIWALLRRDDVIVLLAMVVIPVAGYWYLQLPAATFTKIYNARLLPYWYLGLYIAAGIGIGLAVLAVARWMPYRNQNLAVASVLAMVTVLTVVGAGINDLPGWVRWNYTGVEGKADFHEYEALMREISTLPPGRVMWEANNDLNRYGTPMALMLIPYFSDDHPSMEGLYFESSLTTPFHFLNASEVSERPSNPVRGLIYRPLDMDRAATHLGLYNVPYYVAYTDSATKEARDAGWESLAVSEPFEIFAVPESDPVDIARFEPSVWVGEESFKETTFSWYDDVANLDRWVVADGPEEWERIEDLDERDARPIGDGGVVGDYLLEDDRISFTTTAIGVPHLVKVSYFPNWKASGAEGPWEAAPSLMVVIPTQEDVVLEFERTGDEYIGIALTLAAIVGIVGWMRLRRRNDDAELLEAV